MSFLIRSGDPMMQRFAIFVIWVSCTCALAQGAAPLRNQDVRKVALTRTIRIPAIAVAGHEMSDGAPSNSESFANWPGGPDEPPEGPDGFYAMDDGSFLITDPLRDRIVAIDPQGKFRRSFDVGFPSDRIERLPGGSLMVREATTGQLLRLNGENSNRVEVESEPIPLETAVLENARNGTVAWPAAGTRPAGRIKVVLDKPDVDLVSLQSLGRDRDGSLYVALETTKRQYQSEGLSVSKYVQKYSPDGKLVCETSDLPLDYYVIPVDELHVSKGVVSQLMTTRTEVDINLWDMN
jgi:hypothetical protein